MAKGSKSDPYTMAEYNEMLQNGTWKGGYVKDDNGNVSYTLPELVANGYSGSGSGSGSGSSSGNGSGSDFQFGSYKSFQGDPGLDNDDDDDESDDINKNNNMSGEDGKNLGNEHDYYVSGTGGSGGGEKVPNAGEADLNVEQIYTEEEADTLINRGEWPGGYIIGLGYELPVLYINGEKERLPKYPSTGQEVLERALMFKGAKYKSGGVSMEGMDCSGLVSVALGLDEKWSTGQGDVPGTSRVTITGDKTTFIKELKTGDILVWRYKNSKGENCGHCCIYDDENKKIFHAHGSDGTPTGYTGDLSTYWVKTFGIPKVYRK